MANPDFTIDRVRTKNKNDKYSRSNWEDVDYQIECSEYKPGQIPKNYGAIQLTSEPTVMKIHITPREGYKLNPSKVSNFHLATNVGWYDFGSPNVVESFTEDELIINFKGVHSVYYNQVLFAFSFYMPKLAVSATSSSLNLNWDCDVEGWQSQVDITPVSPVTVEDGTPVDIVVTPKSGYHFADGDSVTWSYGIDSGDFVKQADGSYKFTVNYADWSDGDSISISYTITEDAPVIQTAELNYTCEVANWESEVTISPASPVTIEDGKTVRLKVVAKEGYYFGTEDSVFAWASVIDKVDFILDSDGSYYYDVNYADVDSYTWRIDYTITEDAPVIQTAELNYTCEVANWESEVTISPASPVTIEDGKTVRLKVVAKEGYYFGTEDSVFAWASVIDKVDFILDSDGSYYYDVNYADVDSYTWRIDYTITKGVTPEPSGIYPNFYTVYAPTADNMKVVNNTIFFGDSGVENAVNKFISFKKFFCDIPTDGSKQLTAGNVKFNTVAPLIKASIITIECGKVVVNEKYGSLVDYNPYTNYVLYLPFIGFVDVSSRYITQFGLSVSYEVDVVSGRCLAKVCYYKDADNKICFAEYGGTIASDEPIIQGQVNYRGTYELMTTMQLGDLKCMLYAYTKIPLEGNLAEYKGLPSNEVKTVGDCHGFVSFDSIHVTGVNATNNEKTLIENTLLEGILVD